MPVVEDVTGRYFNKCRLQVPGLVGTLASRGRSACTAMPLDETSDFLLAPVNVVLPLRQERC